MRWLITALFIAGCSAPITSGDLADGVTTSANLISGGTELNPILPDHPAAGLILIPLKQAAKEAMIAAGRDPERVNREFNAGGWAASCWNLAAMAGASTGIGAVAGLACGLVAWEEGKPKDDILCNADKSVCRWREFVCTDDGCWEVDKNGRFTKVQ